jgi:hypothetical protein
MGRKMETVNGVRVGRGWGAILRQSQEHPRYRIGGKRLSRIRYGEESDDPPANPACRDCAAAPGQFHVPGCCLEHCPRCRGQAISCGCFCPFTVPFSPFVPIAGEGCDR